MPPPLDLILDHQLAALQLDNLQIVCGKVHERVVQFVLENLVFAFQFNKMRLYCHTKSPRWLKPQIRPDKQVYTSQRIGRWVSKIADLIFSDLSVTNRD